MEPISPNLGRSRRDSIKNWLKYIYTVVCTYIPHQTTKRFPFCHALHNLVNKIFITFTTWEILHTKTLLFLIWIISRKCRSSKNRLSNSTYSTLHLLTKIRTLALSFQKRNIYLIYSPKQLNTAKIYILIFLLFNLQSKSNFFTTRWFHTQVSNMSQPPVGGEEPRLLLPAVKTCGDSFQLLPLW